MTKPAQHRRLAAILAADVVGYSRLMRADETGTHAALKAHRESIFDPEVAAHNGRIVKLIGDGTLVEFASVVDAVRCAVAVQQSLATPTSNASGITLRIGINIGDIIIDGADIYGDGVNIAARLEAQADPGGICVSSIVRESLGTKLDITFGDGGFVEVKNIDDPVRIWRWHPDKQADPAGTPFPSEHTSAEPASIAVLAFDNLSGDPEQEYFSDGMTEDIITDLSKVGSLLVISRNSTFAYKGQRPDVRTVGRELGVAQVLQGSVRRAGNRLRISAQLINARDGTHIWAERYDRELTDIFAVQDDVTTCIVEALKIKLTADEKKRIGTVPTSSIAAHDLFLKGREAVLSSENTKEMFELALRCFNRAIELDPDYAEPYAGLAHAYTREFQNKWLGIPDALDHSARFLATALEKAPEMPYAHYLDSINKFWRGDREASNAAVDRALSLNPNHALAIGMRGINAVNSGAPLEGLPDLQRALRLEPRSGHLYLHFMGMAHLLAGDFDTAVARFRDRIEASPKTDLSRGLLVSALGHLGRAEEAGVVRRALREINPKYSFSEHVARLPITEKATKDMLLAGYAKAGLDD